VESHMVAMVGRSPLRTLTRWVCHSESTGELAEPQHPPLHREIDEICRKTASCSSPETPSVGRCAQPLVTAEHEEDIVSDQRDNRGLGTGWTRRKAVTLGMTLAAGGTLAVGAANPVSAAPLGQATPLAGAPGDHAEAIIALARDAMEQQDLKAVVLSVTIDGQEAVTEALGESMTGVPATPAMHFRNGAVAISYISTLLLQLVDEGLVSLDDPLSNWLPDLPDANQVTLRMLANMTAGYPDYVQNPALAMAYYENPFRQWTPEELIALGLSTPRVFAPGANWDYSHTDYVILGQALEKITGQPLDVALQERILDPLGLVNTTSAATAEIPDPVLHAFSSERRQALGIPSGIRFYEESTYWNPSWTIAEGAVQTTTVADMTATAIAIGEGTLLTPASHRAQVASDLVGFGAPLEGCPACHTLDEAYAYGLGVVLSGPWILQNPLLAGYGSVAAYLPSRKIAIAVVTTFGEGSFDEEGSNRSGRASWELFAAIAALLAPGEAPSSTRRT
jgi:CubicO group peptidase (beta-lactamase class C family)